MILSSFSDFPFLDDPKEFWGLLWTVYKCVEPLSTPAGLCLYKMQGRIGVESIIGSIGVLYKWDLGGALNSICVEIAFLERSRALTVEAGKDLAQCDHSMIS